ncbi:hypothetical protein [Methylocella sp. CPCC 101449]|jgi:hypothetical protein|uniref:hypothetical protein n=1 Tax=Methylocella sp. CPCC 101449 TaxID=2987531 RepID=UPI00288CF114|nr:hypothetical protein [Methylocella sp. CPCC 101449]MDT2023448.1 hypothetical protein [Methylocella sp. CPCC 101449]HEV2574014.1 hypothetical protein [Beijerinckiaceae bacterium]
MNILVKTALAFSLMAGASAVGAGMAQAGPMSFGAGGHDAGLVQQVQFNPVERAIRHEADRREARRAVRHEMMRREMRREMRRDDMRREMRRDRMRRDMYR